MRISKLDKSLMLLIAITLIFTAIALVGLRATVDDLNRKVMDQHYKIANKDLQLSILWQETNSLQEINAEMNNKNSELRGYTNFLESQNKMLMEENGVEK